MYSPDYRYIVRWHDSETDMFRESRFIQYVDALTFFWLLPDEDMPYLSRVKWN